MQLISDTRNKELALSGIRRLAVSGLQLEPFVRTLFDLTNRGVPYGNHKAFLPVGKTVDGWIGSTPEVASAVPLHQHYYVDSPPEVSGSKFRLSRVALTAVLPRKVIWQALEIMCPDFHRSEGYNVIHRRLGYSHPVFVVYQQHGEFLGFHPIWREFGQKPFTREDIKFFEFAAPSIVHGLKIAQHLARQTDSPLSGFSPLESPPGAVLLNRAGRLLAMDEPARTIFRELAAFDGLPCNRFTQGPVAEAFGYIARIVRSLFHRGSASAALGLPAATFYSHWTGTILKLRGTLLIANDAHDYINVQVERGESSESRRKRFMIRSGLSEREGQVLDLVAAGKTNAEIGVILGISARTIAKHVEHLLAKTGTETRGGLGSIARELRLSVPEILKRVS